MPRPLFDSPFIFGLHDPGGESLMADAGRRGWIVFTEEVGTDPNNTSGKDFTPWSNQDFGIICRINNGYGSVGTIPSSDQYEAFARRVANYVAASPGCKIWIIGNEMNHSQEWPFAPRRASAAPAPAATPAPAPRKGPDQDPYGHGDESRFNTLHQDALRPAADARNSDYEPITPELYARCFRLCRDAIKLLPGHGDDQVLVGAVAPWNNQTTYPGNLNGDWVKYFVDVLNLLGVGGLDGFTLHTYTHGPDPALITDTSTMGPPFQDRYFNFQAFRNFMDAVPAAMRELPAYITETDQDDPWLDQNNGWVQAAYANINAWNQTPGNQQLRSLVLYRWPQIDRWYIVGKQGVIDGFRGAMQNDYRWKAPLPRPAKFKAGDKVKTLDIVNFRQAPAGQTITQLPINMELTVVSSQYVLQNGLIWWNLRQPLGTGTRDGWVAQYTADGVVLLAAVETSPPVPPPTFGPGDQVQALTIVRMRKSPGTSNKPADDIVADVPANTVLTVFGGPQEADNMTWWRNTGRLPDGRQVEGWMSEALPDGTKLLTLYAPAPEPPAITEDKLQVGDHFQTLTIVRLRRSPGANNKPANDVIAEIPTGAAGKIIGGPTAKDAMNWWQVQVAGRDGALLTGWMAEALADGTPLLVEAKPQGATFAPGDLATTADFANVRRSAGIDDKPADDVLGMLPPDRVVTVLAGPEAKDELTWWRVGGILADGSEVKGNVAERAPGGQPILVLPPKLAGTNVPDKATQNYLRPPFDGVYGVAQLWGDPSFYNQFVYDGVALQGHNGIDFLTPTGTLIYAVDGGEVLRAENEAGGFGNFVLLRHPWGESIYAHLATLGVVAGQVVGRGQPIGISGNTGASTGPHLHFAVRNNPYSRADGWGGYRDPLPYLPPAAYILPPYVLDPATLSIAAALPVPTGPGLRDNPPGMGDIPGTQRP